MATVLLNEKFNTALPAHTVTDNIWVQHLGRFLAIRNYDNLLLFVASVNVELDPSLNGVYCRLEDT